MALITMPTGSGIAEIDWKLPLVSAFVAQSGWTGKTTVADLGKIKIGWRATVRPTVGKAPHNAAWRGFFAKLRGPVNTFQLDAANGAQSSCPASTAAMLGTGQIGNSCLYSEQFDNAAWGKNLTAAITANTGVAPDGTTTMDTFDFSGNVSANVYQDTALAVVALTTYTFSLWLVGTPGQTLTLQATTTTGVGGTANTTVTLTATAARYSVSVTMSGAPTGNLRVFILRNSGTVTNFKGWGAQAEVGTSPSGYIRTTSAAAISYDMFSIAGLPSSSTILLEGQLVTIKNRLFTLTAPLTSDSGGNAVAWVFPPLPSLTASTDIVYLRNPYCLMRMMDSEPGMTARPGAIGIPTEFNALEVLG